MAKRAERVRATESVRRAVRVFADGADLGAMRGLAQNPVVVGFTTNPSLLRRAGVQRYRAFALKALEIAGGHPVSFEVLADDHTEMARQARGIAGLGGNAWVKIPVTDSRGRSSADIIAELSGDGIQLNVTAVFTVGQVEEVGRALARGSGPAVVSVFAGRIADAGVDPLAHVSECRQALRAACPRAEMLWASPRQVYDRVLAERAGCDIITMTPDLIAKLPTLGKDLEQFSLETVQMFARDAAESGLAL